MLTDDQADFFNSLLSPMPGAVVHEYLYRAALDVLVGQEALLWKAVDILDACGDPAWKSHMKVIQLEGDKEHRYWIVRTDVETNAADCSDVREASIQEHMCLLTGCSCASFADLSRAKSGKEVMCEHMLAVRLAPCMGLINEREALGAEKYSEALKAATLIYFNGQQQR